MSRQCSPHSLESITSVVQYGIRAIPVLHALSMYVLACSYTLDNARRYRKSAAARRPLCFGPEPTLLVTCLRPL